MGRWIVNGTDLSTYAYNITERASGFALQGKRGQNLERPGIDGELYQPNKVFAAKKVTLNMWALGAMPDGSMPTVKTRAMVCRENIERLFSLFADTAQLTEVVRVESAGYGTVNRFPNPACEATLPGGTGYRNLVTNPAQVTQTPREARRNLAPDPGVRTRTPSTPYAENLVSDPYHKRYRTAAVNNITRNYYAASSWDTGWDVGEVPSEGWWVPGGSATAQVVAATGGRGRQALRIQATAALPTEGQLGRRGAFTFPAGQTPNFRCRVRRLQNTTTTRSVIVRALWYDTDAVGAVHTSATPWTAPFTLPSGNTGWADISVPGSHFGAAPEGFMAVEFRTGQAWADNDGFLLDAANVTTDSHIPTEAAPFFDGDETWGEWNATPGRSTSWVRGNVDPNWTPAGTRNAYYAYAVSTRWDAPGSAVGFVAHRHTPGGTQQFTLPCQPATPGTPYTLRFRGRALTGVTCTVELCTSAGGTLTSRGSVQVTGTGSPAQWETGSGMTGTILEYQGPTHTPAAGEVFVVRVTVPVRATGDQALQLTSLGVTDYFGARSGETGDSANTEYVWAGTVWQSKTVIRRFGNPQFTGRHTAVTVPAVEMICRRTGEATQLTMVDVPVTQQARDTGFAWSCQATTTNLFADNVPATQPQVRAVARGVDTGGQVVATWTGPSVYLPVPAPDAGYSTPVPLTTGSASIPTTVTALRCTVELVNPLISQAVEVSSLQVSDHYSTAALPYFDGATPGGAWTGTANASPSVLTVQGPATYSVPQGLITAPPAGVTAVTAQGTGGPDIVVAVDVGNQTAGQYRVGAEVSSSVAGTVYAQLTRSGTVVGETYLGTLTGQTNLTQLEQVQATVTVSGPGTQLRFRFRPATGPAGPQVTFRVGRGYLFTVADSHLPRIPGNRVQNAQFVQGAKTWTSPTGTVAVVTTSFGRPLQATGTSITTTSTSPATPSQQVWVYARVQTRRSVQLNVVWLNSTGGTLSRVTAATSLPDDQLRTVQGVVTAPAGAASCTVQVVPVGAVKGEITNLYGLFLGVVGDGYDSGPGVNPLAWAYFDGSTKVDVSGTDVRWDGAVHASTSSTAPRIPQGWLDTGIVTLAAPPLRPAGSKGRVIAFPGFANAAAVTVPTKEGGYSGYLGGYADVAAVANPVPDTQTLTARTVPLQRVGNFLSGEVSVARPLLASQVTVRVVGCDDDTGLNPTIMFSYQLVGLDERVTWRDLGRAGDYVYLEVVYAETAPNPGYAAVLDNVMVLDTDSRLIADYPGYFDGYSPSASWQGTPSASPSTNYAGARRFYGEVLDDIAPTSMAGGTRAEFDVTWTVPAAFWEDMATSRFTGATSDPVTEMPLEEFTGSTARNTTSVVTLTVTQGTGPTQVTLRDKKSGTWLRISHQILIGDTVTVDCQAFSVTLLRGGTRTSLGTKITRGGSSPLLPLTPFSIDSPPVLVVDAPTFDGVLNVDVFGRRKYLVA